jgi:hypothetical protein
MLRWRLLYATAGLAFLLCGGATALSVATLFGGVRLARAPVTVALEFPVGEPAGPPAAGADRGRLYIDVAPPMVATRDAAWLGRQLDAGWRPALYLPVGRWAVALDQPSPATLSGLLVLLGASACAVLWAEERYLAACE